MERRRSAETSAAWLQGSRAHTVLLALTNCKGSGRRCCNTAAGHTPALGEGLGLGTGLGEGVGGTGTGCAGEGGGRRMNDHEVQAHGKDDKGARVCALG